MDSGLRRNDVVVRQKEEGAPKRPFRNHIQSRD
jgi:hypothetical protein